MFTPVCVQVKQYNYWISIVIYTPFRNHFKQLQCMIQKNNIIHENNIRKRDQIDDFGKHFVTFSQHDFYIESCKITNIRLYFFNFDMISHMHQTLLLTLFYNITIIFISLIY